MAQTWNRPRSSALTGSLKSLRRKLSRLVVPEECQRDQGDSNDPQNNVFTAVFFFGHKVQYSIPQVLVQVSL
jgi:hypothetical protein